MKDIFKNAKFRDRFYTMDGRILTYHCAKPIFHGAEMIVANQLIEEFNSDFILCDDSGKCLNMPQYGNDYDVVDRYVEKIDEEELDKLAVEYADHAEMTGTLPDGYNTGCWDYLDIVEAYKAGRLS